MQETFAGLEGAHVMLKRGENDTSDLTDSDCTPRVTNLIGSASPDHGIFDVFACL